MTIWEQLRDLCSCRDLAIEASVEFHGTKATCPFCKHASSFWADEHCFVCHACHRKGDVFEFTAAMLDTDRWGACKALAQERGVEWHQTPADVQREERSSTYRALAERYADLPDHARAYLHERGLTDAFIESHLLGYVPPDVTDQDPGTGLPGILRGRVLIPFWHGPQIVYLTGRAVGDTSGPKYMNIRGPKQYIGTMRGPQLVVTEGIFDQLLAEQAGYSCIGLAGSGATPKLHSGIHRVLLVMDRDEAGAAFEDRYGVEFYTHQESGLEVEVATLPAELDGIPIKDLADFLRLGGKVEDLPRESILDRYVTRLAAAPKDKQLKRTLYDLLRHADPLDREQVFAQLGKLLTCGIKAIRSDYASVVQVELESDYQTPEGIRFKVPDGYRMNGHGIECGKSILTYESIVIDQVGKDRKSAEEYYRIRWGTNGSTIIPRLALAKSQDLLDYARWGFPVNSSNAIGLVRFLDAWNAANRDKYTSFNVVSQLGWDDEQFILPKRIIDLRADADKDQTYYIDHTIPADAYEPHGTLEGWVDTIKLLAAGGPMPDATVARFLLYAGAASSLLGPLNRRPFIIHLHGDTSLGKSTALRIPASIYGNPTESKALIRWKNTENFIVRYMEKLKNIPLIIDESSSETRMVYESIIYQMEAGVSKGKALKSDPHGTAALRTFRLGVFSSGEPPVLNERFLSGAQIRVIEFLGSPFGGELSKDVINAFNAGLDRHYGHAVDHFIKAFLQQRGTIDWTQSPIKDQQFTPTEERMKRHLDLIWIAGEIVEELFHFGFSPADDVIKCFSLLRERLFDKVRMADKIVAAVADHYQENQNSFPKVSRESLTGPHTAKIPQSQKVFGYIFEQDLGLLKTHFKSFITEILGHQNSGDYAINILKTAGIITSPREERRVNGQKISLVYFRDFFRKDVEEVF